MAALLALAGCQGHSSRFVYRYPGIDPQTPRFKEDRTACRYEGLKATAALRDDTLRFLRAHEVYRACMRARNYPVEGRLDL